MAAKGLTGQVFREILRLGQCEMWWQHPRHDRQPLSNLWSYLYISPLLIKAASARAFPGGLEAKRHCAYQRLNWTCCWQDCSKAQGAVAKNSSSKATIYHPLLNLMSQLGIQSWGGGPSVLTNLWGTGAGVIGASSLEPHNHPVKQMGLWFLSQRKALWLRKGNGALVRPGDI